VQLALAAVLVLAADLEPAPPSLDAVPVKYSSSRSFDRPTASKICAAV
jgi:hypothetical protein